MENKGDMKQLVASILAGDVERFGEIIDEHQKLVGHIVFRMIRKEADREDLCQDIFVKVYQNLASFQFESKLSTWVATIAYNTCLNHLEKKKTLLYEDLKPEDRSWDTAISDDAGPEEFAEAQDISERLRDEIGGLPLIYRTVLTLYHLDDMSYKEISEITKLPDGTVKSHLFRARKLLKDKLTAKYSREDICH